MANSERILREAEEVLRRHSPEGRGLAARARRRRLQSYGRRAKRVLGAEAAILIGAILFGALVAPLGAGGVMLVLLLMVVAAFALAVFPIEPEATPETIAQVELKALPLQTERWLEGQRPALPPPAMRLVDDIGVRLEALAPQLQTLDEREPAAAEIRRLVGHELPELVAGYRRVPEGLRREERYGLSPDRQLVEGLGVVESELARMSAQLASGDLDKLATQGKYLELKYRGDDGLKG